MLTNEKRKAIVERFRKCNDCGFYDIYTAITGEKVPVRTTRDEDFTAISNVILDLCDTSNMLELPLDKNGEIIRIHDVVYDNTGMEREVSEFRFPFYGACIYARTDDDRSTFRPDELAHKKQVTIKSLVEELRSTLCAAYISGRECEKILHIADQLESLGDSDD